MKDEKTGAFYVFTAGRWLDSKQEDKKTDIIILVGTSLVPGGIGMQDNITYLMQFVVTSYMVCARTERSGLGPKH